MSSKESSPAQETSRRKSSEEIARASCEVVCQLGKPYHWIQSFVTDDKIYCIHIAESEELIREHARLGGFPINTVSEVKAVIDPMTSNLL
ncbi:DUF4242 domain-containing protein [Puia sp. P3]|uniref:DUF4242 domain-containing protein n=1 Tax=Puia sp. P3 TaxID=3423952 RepID=UPI003D66670F